jgi:hypothetical protein
MPNGGKEAKLNRMIDYIDAAAAELTKKTGSLIKQGFPLFF